MVLLCEHTPVYTIGLRESINDQLIITLEQLGAQVIKVYANANHN